MKTLDDHTHYPNPSSSFNGWTCQSCGTWVPNGCTHSCPTTTWPNNWPTPPFTQMDCTPTEKLLTPGNRIADLLERLVIAIERKENP